MQIKVIDKSKLILLGLTMIFFGSIIDLALFGYKYTGNIGIIFAVMIWVIVNFFFITKITNDKQYERLNQQFEEYEKTLIPLIEEIRMSQHDFKNHLNTMYSLSRQDISKDTESEIQNYVKSLESNLLEIDSSLSMKNKVLGSVLYRQTCILREKNIQFFMDLPPYEIVIPVDKFETSYIINLLFKYVLEEPEPRAANIKEVTFRMDYDNTKPYIEIRVSGPDLLSYKSKAKEKNMREIKKAVNKYSGKIIFYHEASYSCLQVVFT